MHVVDVNSGNKMGRNHEEALLKVNMDSAREIARQAGGPARWEWVFGQ